MIGIAICGIVLYGSKKDYQKQYHKSSVINSYTNSSGSGTKTKFQELKSMHEKNLITEDEYNKKKQEILNKM